MKQKVLKPKVVGNRGKAIPLGDNFYYMQGPKHSQGGIPIGKNPKTGIEVEGEEVMHISPKEVKVFSSVPFLNGESPAEKVLEGEEPNKVFKQQEDFKDRNKIKDDGTKKKALGGDVKQTLNKVNSSKADFVKRLKDKNRINIVDWSDSNSITTHKLSVGTDNKGNNYIYPEVQNIKGKLIDFTRPPYKNTAGRQSAEERGDTVRVNSINEGVEFTKKYKDYYPNFNKKAMGGKDDNPIANRLKNNIKSNVSKSEMIIKDAKNVYNKFIKPVALTYSALEAANIVGNTLLNVGAKGLYAAGKGIYNSGKVSTGTQLSKAAYNLGKFTVKNTRNASYKTANRINTAIDVIDGNHKDAGVGVAGDAVINRIPGHKYIKYIAKPTIDNTLNFINKDKKAMGGISRNKIVRNKFERGGKPDNKKQKDYLPSTGGLERDNQLVTARVAEIGRVTTPNYYKLADTGDKQPTHISPTTGEKLKAFAVRTLTESGPNMLSDVAGTGANVIGAIKGYKANKRMLNKLKYSDAPAARQAAKLKTKININPQLDKMRETVAAYERDVNANTASSRVGLQRKQLARMASMLETNELYSKKENAETELINRDKLNQQAVADRNVTEYNQWAKGKADFNNNLANLKAENKVSYIDNLNNSVQDLIARRDNRRREDLDRELLGLANPNAKKVTDGKQTFKRDSKKKK